MPRLLKSDLRELLEKEKDLNALRVLQVKALLEELDLVRSKEKGQHKRVIKLEKGIMFFKKIINKLV